MVVIDMFTGQLFCVSDKGRIVIWGDNKHGQCCLDPGTEPIVPKPRLIPQKMFENKAVSELHSGWTHLLAKTGKSATIRR